MVCQLEPFQWRIIGVPPPYPDCFTRPTAQALDCETSATAFRTSSKKRASGPSTTVHVWPSQCSVRAPVPEFRIEQQSDPTAHASAGELALTPFSRLSPLNGLGLGTTENAAPAVPGAPSAATAATSAARVSSRDDIGPLSSRR